MVKVLSSDVFYSKVGNYKCECDGAGLVAPNRWGMTYWFITLWCEVVDKLFICNVAGLLYARNLLSNFHTYVPVVFQYL